MTHVSAASLVTPGFCPFGAVIVFARGLVLVAMPKLSGISRSRQRRNVGIPSFGHPRQDRVKVGVGGSRRRRGWSLPCNTKTESYDTPLGAFGLRARCALYDNAPLAREARCAPPVASLPACGAHPASSRTAPAKRAAVSSLVRMEPPRSLPTPAHGDRVRRSTATKAYAAHGPRTMVSPMETTKGRSASGHLTNRPPFGYRQWLSRP